MQQHTVPDTLLCPPRSHAGAASGAASSIWAAPGAAVHQVRAQCLPAPAYQGGCGGGTEALGGSTAGRAIRFGGSLVLVEQVEDNACSIVSQQTIKGRKQCLVFKGVPVAGRGSSLLQMTVHYGRDMYTGHFSTTSIMATLAHYCT